MSPNLSPLIRYPVHHNLKYKTIWEGVKNMPFAIRRKIWGGESFTIALFFSVSSNTPMTVAEKDISQEKRGKKKPLGWVGGGDRESFQTWYLGKLSGSIRERRAVQL